MIEGLQDMYISNVKDENAMFYHEYVDKSKITIDCYPKGTKTCAFLFSPKGKLFLHTSQGKQVVSNNEVLFIPSNTFAKLERGEGEECEIFCVCFSEELLVSFNDFVKEIKEVKCIYCFDKKELLSLFERMEFYLLNLQEENITDVVQTFLKELVLFLKVSQSSLVLYQDKEYPPILVEVLSYINKNFCTIKNVSEISSTLYISYSYLVKLFKNYLKTTPKKYLTEQRLLLAQKLIEEGRKPTSVFEVCGFESYSIFYRCYFSRFGYSPSKQFFQKTKKR